MHKIITQKPLLIAMYGFPGAGKTYIARQLTEVLQIAHVSGDRIRGELFDQPLYDKQENQVITQLMNYMTEEFLSSGVSVVYDVNAMRYNQRYSLRDLARKAHAAYMLIWIQIDQDSAFARTQSRDRRTSDDRYAMAHTADSFMQYISAMQNPKDEEYLVVSGKHTFATQKNTILNRLYQMGLVHTDNVQSSVTKPELVNLVPNPKVGRVDLNRRNIVIR